LVTIKTTGDKILDAPLATIGGKGLFTKEIEEALLDGRVDLAVHSMKDLPTELPQGLKLGGVMEREDPRDVFVSRDGIELTSLQPGAVIGTSSLRRRAFLLNRFPSIQVTSIRGNVDTRLKKVETENLAGIVLAAAGVKRMGFAERVTAYLDSDTMIPAIGQGALGIETRADDPRVQVLLSGLNHAETAACVRAERAFLRRMGGGCQVPMAAHAVIQRDRLTLTAAIVDPDGRTIVKDTVTGDVGDMAIGPNMADALVDRGGLAVVKSVLGEDWKPGPNQWTE